MTPKPSKKKPNPATKRLAEQKAMLKDTLEFLERQATMPYTLRGQAETLQAQIGILKKYLK